MKNQIVSKLEKFQEGYSKRDIEKIDEFAQDMFLDSDDTIIIGTGHGEWCKGISVIKELLYIDWFYWGNFTLDLDNAHIFVTDEFATVHTTGVLQKPFKKEAISNGTVKLLDEIINSEEKSEEKIYKSLKSIAYYLHEANIGADTRRKVRFSATLKKESLDWKFVNIHFSYPVSPPTDIKVIDQ